MMHHSADVLQPAVVNEISHKSILGRRPIMKTGGSGKSNSGAVEGKNGGHAVFDAVALIRNAASGHE